MRGLKGSALVNLMYISRVIGESVRKMLRIGNSKDTFMRQMIYYLVENQIRNKTVHYYFQRLIFLRICIKNWNKIQLITTPS